MVVINILILGSVSLFCGHQLGLSNRATREQGQILGHILKCIGDGVAVADSEGKFILFNPAADKLTGLGMLQASPEMWATAYGIYETDMQTPFPTEKFPLIRALRGESVDNCEQYLKNDSKPKGTFLSVTGRPLIKDNGQIMGGVVIFRDITEEKKEKQRIYEEKKNLEEKIRERINELQESQLQILHLQKMDAVGRLAGGVAHDFNNILGAILMYNEVLALPKVTEAQKKESFDQIEKAVERGAALTRQLLVFGTNRSIDVTSVNFNSIILNLTKMLRRLVGENYTIETSLADNLWNVEGDPIQLEQILLNLVLNARDAMASGGKIKVISENVDISVALSNTKLPLSPGPHVGITVIDFGTGMDQSVIEKIFEPFFTTKPLGKGTGLGLSTVYGIVKQMKGSIEVISEFNSGSEFKLYFPRHQGQELDDDYSIKKIPNTHVKKHILLVEDEQTLCELFCESLERLGHEVFNANTPRDALSVLKDNTKKIDLLFTDIILPEMSGTELVKEAIKLRPDIKILFMSGKGDEAIYSEFEQKDSWSFIQKPFDGAALANKLLQVFKLPS